jgi:hypothetical protein
MVFLLNPPEDETVISMKHKSLLSKFMSKNFISVLTKGSSHIHAKNSISEKKKCAHQMEDSIDDLLVPCDPAGDLQEADEDAELEAVLDVHRDDLLRQGLAIKKPTQNTPKNPLKKKTKKKPKTPTGLVFFKTPGFFQPCLRPFDFRQRRHLIGPLHLNDGGLAHFFAII